MAETGCAFRATDAYVTDGSGDDWVDSDFFAGGTYPTTLANGLTVGWQASTNGTDSRNRSTGVNVRLAGLHFNKTATEQVIFRIDLPGGAGAYNIRAAFGEPTYAVSDDYYQFRDDTTAFSTINHAAGHSAANWYDATDVLRTSSSDWTTNNARLNRTFSSSIFRLAMGRGAGAAGNSVIAYLSVEAAAGGGSTIVSHRIPESMAFKPLTGIY